MVEYMGQLFFAEEHAAKGLTVQVALDSCTARLSVGRAARGYRGVGERSQGRRSSLSPGRSSRPESLRLRPSLANEVCGVGQPLMHVYVGLSMSDYARPSLCAWTRVFDVVRCLLRGLR